MATAGPRHGQDVRHDIDEFADGLARLQIGLVNLFFVGTPGTGTTPWVLVDAGLPSGAAQVLTVAAQRFGRDRRPTAIVLTHGHFDHVGALEPLLRVWDVPVYAHPLELPFVTGEADYPPPDPTVGDSAIARWWSVAPERGINLGERARALPAGGGVPGLPDWHWVHTPGHTPGHVSLFRAADRVLITGDVVTTTRPEGLPRSSSAPLELGGPPAAFTSDWDQARRSVATIASLQPVVVAPGHGAPLRGSELPGALAALARDFDYRIRPRRGRYVAEPVVANDASTGAETRAQWSTGVRWGMLSGVAAAAFAGTWLYRRFGRRAEND